jgi:uncharacterized membrane protein YqjE
MPIAASQRPPANSIPAANGAPRVGMLDSVRACVATTASLVRTRLEIISAELEEQREWLQSLLLLAVAGVFLLSMGIVLVTLFVVVLFWETHRTAVLGGFSALYLGAGVWAVLALKAKLGTRPKLFSTTTAELAKDEDRLTP